METIITLLLPMIVGHAEVGPGIYQIDLLTPQNTIVNVVLKEESSNEHSGICP